MNNVVTIIPLGGTEQSSIQGQILTPMLTTKLCGSLKLSVGLVRMPPLGVSRPHTHWGSEVVVMVTTGLAATLAWDEVNEKWLRYVHGEGELCFIPARIPHVAVNLRADELRAIEIRSDPTFNNDVALCPVLDDSAAEAVRAVQVWAGNVT
jgi:uncharacterized RmlC-like cupin family protein